MCDTISITGFPVFPAAVLVADTRSSDHLGSVKAAVRPQHHEVLFLYSTGSSLTANKTTDILKAGNDPFLSIMLSGWRKGVGWEKTAQRRDWKNGTMYLRISLTIFYSVESG